MSVLCQAGVLQISKSVIASAVSKAGDNCAQRWRGLVAAAFAFFLTGAAKANTGQGFKALGGNGVAAFPAAGHTIDPFRPATVHCGTRTHEG